MVYVTKETLESFLNLKGSSHLKENTSGCYSLDESSFDPTGFKGKPNKTNPCDELTEEKAFKKIERLVKVRDRSVCEVIKRLEKDAYPQDCIDAAVARAKRCGYLDDERFADVLIRSRLRAGKGLAGIVSELKRHNINPEIQVPHFPDAYLCLFPSQKDSAIALLCKKPPRSKNKLQAAYAKLVRSGYSSSLASEAAHEWYRTQE